MLELLYVSSLPLLLLSHSSLIFSNLMENDGVLLVLHPQLVHVVTQAFQRGVELLPIVVWRKMYPLRHLRDFLMRDFLMLLLRSMSGLSCLLHPFFSDGLVLFNEDVSFYVNPS